MKKTLSWLIVLALLVGMMPAVFATEETQTAGFVASELGYENGVAVENIEGEVISFAFSDGGNSYGNCPKYYTSGTAIRFYSENTLTISAAEGYEIKSVTITTDSSKPMNAENTALTNAEAAYADDVTVLTPVDGTQDIVMAYTSSSGHWRVQAVDVVYAAAESEGPGNVEVENPLVDGNNEIELLRNAEEASVYNYVATQTGTLYIAAVEFFYSASWTEGYEDNSGYMEDWTNYTIFTVNGEELDGGWYGSIEVVAGEIYTFSWSHNEYSTYGFLATLNLSYTDENIPVPGVDFALAPSYLPMNTVEIPAGEMVLYTINYEFSGYVLTVTGENAYIYYEFTDWWTGEVTQNRIDAVDGVVEYDLDLHTCMEIYIGNDGAEAATFALDYYAPLGGVNNPYIVETLDEIAVTIPAGHEGYFYYKWIATEVGTIWVTPGMNYINFENLTSQEYGNYDDTWENYYVYVEAGDELLIAITGWYEEDTFFQFTYDFVPGYRAGSEQNPFEVDLLEGLELNLYNETVYYTWTPEQSMTVTLDFTLMYNWSSNVPTMEINGETFEFGTISFEGEVATVSAQLNVTAGEPVTMVLSAVSSVYGTLVANIVVEVENPLVDGNNEIELPRAAEEASVYNYVATQTGTLYIAAVEFYYEASWSEGYEDNSGYMEDWIYQTIFTVNGEELEGGWYGSIEVVAGEIYTFSWSLTEDAQYGFKAVVNLSYTDENIPVPGVDFALAPSYLPMNTVEIPAGESVLYTINYEFSGYVLTVTGENAYIYYEFTDWWTGETVTTRIDAVDGVVEYDLDVHSCLEIYIGNDGAEAATFALDYYAPLGGLHNPYIVDSLDEIELNIPAQHEGYIYYKWIATEVGTIWVTPGEFYVNFENLTTGEYGDYDDTWENYSIYVMPGDELLIAITGWFEEDTPFNFEMVNYRFVPGYRAGSEQNPFEVDLLEVLDLNLYNETVYYTWTPEQSMIVTLDFTLKYSWSSNVPTVLINGEEYTLGEELTVTAGEPVTMVLSTVPSVYGTLVANIVEIIEEPAYVEIADGKYVISWGEFTFGALKETYSYGYVYPGNVNELTDTDYITITNVGEGQFTMQDCYGRYIYMTGTYNSFNVSAEAPAEGHLWVLEETEGGLLLKNVLKEKYVAYSEQYGSWGCYSSISETSVLTITAVAPAPTGDANGDGDVDYLDAMLVAQVYVGDITEEDLDMAAADVNGDGDVDYLDAMLIAQFYVGDIDSFEP